MDCRKRQTTTATPAKPGGLPLTLGSVDISSQEYAGGGEVDEGEEVTIELVEAGEDTAELFELAEQGLDLVPFLVERPVGLAWCSSSRVGRDDGRGVARGDPVEDLVAVIGAVGDVDLGVDSFEQGDGLRRVAGLAGGQGEAVRIAERVADRMELGREAAA